MDTTRNPDSFFWKGVDQEILPCWPLGVRGERERLFGSREREGKLEITFPFYGKGMGIRKCYGKEMGNLRLVIPGILGIPGNHIKSKVKFKIWFIFMPWPAIHKTANTDSISRLNSRPKLPFPGNGKGNYKIPREGKFEACIPGNHRKREFPLTPVSNHEL